jgi:hypothetical protein
LGGAGRGFFVSFCFTVIYLMFVAEQPYISLTREST